MHFLLIMAAVIHQLIVKWWEIAILPRHLLRCAVCLSIPFSILKWKWSDTAKYVWWPILVICALHLTHQKCTHTVVNTHTMNTHPEQWQPFMLRLPGSSWGSVPCSRVSPKSWYWRWRERCTFTPPTYNSCRCPDILSYPSDFPTSAYCACAHQYCILFLTLNNYI